MTLHGRVQHRSAQLWARVWPLMLSMVFGCAAFRSGQLDDPSPWPPAPMRAAQPTLLVDPNGSSRTSGPTRLEVAQKALMGTNLWVALVGSLSPAGGVSPPQPEAFHGGLADCIDTLRQSKLFSRVDTGSPDPDLYLTGDTSFQTELSTLGTMLAALTYSIIPAHVWTERWHIEARVMSARSQRSKDVVLEDTSSTWVGLVLLPVAPFRWPDSEHAEAKERMCRSLALAIRDASEEFGAAQ